MKLTHKNKLFWLNVVFEEDPNAGGGGGGGGEPAWNAGISEDLRGDMALKPFDSLDSMAKSVISSQQMLGTRIPIPGEDATPEVRGEFNEKLSKIPGVFVMPEADDADGLSALYNKLGRPEKAEGYEVTRPAEQNGVKYDETTEGWFREIAHKHGLSQTQMAGVMGDWNENVAAQAGESNQLAEAGKTALRQKWGAGYDQNIGIAKTVIRENGSEALAEKFEAVIGEDPEIAELFHKLGLKTLEDSVIKNLNGGGEAFRTAEQINADIATSSADKAYTNARDPNHKAITEKVSKLYQELDKLKNGSKT